MERDRQRRSVAIVASAGSGIGRASAGEWWRVVLAGRPRDALDETAASAGEAQTLALPIDELAMSEWTCVVSAYLTGVFLLRREAFRVVKRQEPQGGRIVTAGRSRRRSPGRIRRPTPRRSTVSRASPKAVRSNGRAYDIAVGQIDIGRVASDMTSCMVSGVLPADGSVSPEPVTARDDVARSVAHMAPLPLGANVLRTTVIATAMPFVGRG